MSEISLCPHRSLSIDHACFEFSGLSKSLSGESEIEACTSSACTTKLTTSVNRRRRGDRSYYMLKTMIRLFEVLDGRVSPDADTLRQYFMLERITSALAKFSLPICAHISLSEAKVAKRLTSKIWNEGEKGPLRTRLLVDRFLPSSVGECPRCQSAEKVSWYALTSKMCLKTGTQWHFVEIYRDFSTLRDPRAAQWTCHAVDERQSVETRMALVGRVLFIEDVRQVLGSTPVAVKENGNCLKRLGRWLRGLRCGKAKSRREEAEDETAMVMPKTDGVRGNMPPLARVRSIKRWT